MWIVQGCLTAKNGRKMFGIGCEGSVQTTWGVHEKKERED